MAERKHNPFARLSSSNIGEYANKIVHALNNSADPVPAPELCDELRLSKGQLATVIKYMRRCSLKNFGRYIKFYPISSKRGYSLPKSWEEFKPCFATLYLWSRSLLKTIEPMKRKMIEEGIDYEEYIKNLKSEEEDDEENYLDLLELAREGSDNWFFDD